jgi:hypothetical protein
MWVSHPSYGDITVKNPPLHFCIDGINSCKKICQWPAFNGENPIRFLTCEQEAAHLSLCNETQGMARKCRTERTHGRKGK